MTTRERAVEWIQAHDIGAVFSLSQLYCHLQQDFAHLCNPRVLTPDGKEPKWQKDARWALQDCKARSTVKHLGHNRMGQVAANVGEFFSV